MKRIQLWLAAAVVAMCGSLAVACECCDHCGCECNVRKVCRLKCETKKVPKVSYTCECEDFCIPGPSKKCGCTCECDPCKCKEHCKPNWIPQCAKVHTRTKLIKHTEDKEEKVYKWVVEYVCDNCSQCGCGNGDGCGACEGGACDQQGAPADAAPPAEVAPPMAARQQASPVKQASAKSPLPNPLKGWFGK